jgi:hypothetical protein
MNCNCKRLYILINNNDELPRKKQRKKQALILIYNIHRDENKIQHMYGEK